MSGAARKALEEARALLEDDMFNVISAERRLKVLAEIDAALAEQPAAGTVDGWKMVPVEPTKAMLVAGAAAVRDFYSEEGQYPRTKAMHRAMLAAAPNPPTVQPSGATEPTVAAIAGDEAQYGLNDVFPGDAVPIGHRLKAGLNALRAACTSGSVTSREIFRLTDPLMDLLARAERNSGRKPEPSGEWQAGIEALTDDILFIALNTSGITTRQRESAIRVRWKDGIDIDEPAEWLRRFAENIAAAIRALRPASAPEDGGAK